MAQRTVRKQEEPVEDATMNEKLRCYHVCNDPLVPIKNLVH